MRFYMLKKLLVLSFLSIKAFGDEIKWELLKTLTVDPKTKNPTPGAELKKVIGKESTIKGFMMPLDYDSKEVSEFLFMPYIPACMHVPPPPPNQLILVKMKKGTKAASSFYPIELTGVLTIEANKELESSFKMDGLKVKELKNEPQATFSPN